MGFHVRESDRDAGAKLPDRRTEGVDELVIALRVPVFVRELGGIL